MQPAYLTGVAESSRRGKPRPLIGPCLPVSEGVGKPPQFIWIVGNGVGTP